MPGTMFDDVGGTSKKEAKAPAKPKKAKAAKPETGDANATAGTEGPQDAKVGARPKGSNVNTVTLPGVKGTTTPLYVDGAMRRLKLGEPIDVTDAELAVLKKNGMSPE